MEELFSTLALRDIHSDLFRNIVSLRISQNLFDDLSYDPEAWESAIQLEMDTRPKVFSNTDPCINRPFEEAEWNEAVGYPFKNSSQSRFSDGTYGVWYGADSLETTIFETAYHWQNKLLSDAGFNRPGVSIERKVYLVKCDSALIDLRSAIERNPEILHPNDYTATHAIGSKIHREGHPGLITKSARYSEGDVYAIFTPKILSNVRHTCYLTYITTERGIEIQKSLGETFLVI